MTKSFILKLSIGAVIVLLIVAYGFYEKYRKEKLYTDFRANMQIQCGDTIVQKHRGWRIKGNRFFTNGKIIKTIVFCKSID